MGGIKGSDLIRSFQTSPTAAGLPTETLGPCEGPVNVCSPESASAVSHLHKNVKNNAIIDILSLTGVASSLMLAIFWLVTLGSWLSFTS